MVRRITSLDNPLIKSLVGLTESSRERRRRAQCILDGPHLIEALMAAGGVADRLVASDSGLARDEVARLFETCPANERVVLSDRVFDRIAAVATPVGILASIDVPVPPALPDKLNDCVMLDGLQDAGNVGSILRSAAAAGVRTILASEGTAFLWSPRVLRAGMGAHFGLAIYESQPLPEWVGRCRGSVLVTTGGGDRDLFEADLRGPTAWVFGNEGAGASDALLSLASQRIRIPMPGRVESINVAAAAAVCLFEQVRQRQLSGEKRPQ